MSRTAVVLKLLVLLYVSRGASNQLGTVCSTYQDISKAETCFEQTIFIKGAFNLPSTQNYVTKDQLNSIITAKLQNLSQSFDEQIKEVDNKLKMVKSIIRKSCLDGLLYQNQCIKLYIETISVNYNEARKICSNDNSSLAEITSDTMYERVYDYVKMKWANHIKGTADKEFVRVWLGSSYQFSNYPNHQITLSNGTEVKLKNWYPRAPYSTATRIHMALLVQAFYNQTYSGLFNSGIVNQYFILPLCAYKI